MLVIGVALCLAAAPSAAPPIPPEKPLMIAAAGDIAGRGYSQDKTAALLRGLRSLGHMEAILALGDTQYPAGDLVDYLADYGPSWGIPDLKAITHPVPGNHEYDQGRTNAEGYFDYFNGTGAERGIAGERGKGYYSFDRGEWHFLTATSYGLVVTATGSDVCR